MGFFADIKAKAKLLKRQSMVLYYAVRDPRTPLGVKFLAGAIVAYALSPIDLIPDFIPVLGYLDEVILLPMAFAGGGTSRRQSAGRNCAQSAQKL
jgi:uncharacterized membrane protein YkvA (DUF1232 family)